ncbi:MAG: histidine phosphatase family protein [Beijerinckiaceae bacterium]|nr:histidine phosphatase family protein [Beijerinckiaceae bacterium]
MARVEASETAAWDQLRAGGVVLFRHANAPGIGDPPGFRLDDCATQRNLGAAGREQAVRIGDRLRMERVSVSAVLSSHWCRALETARLAFPGLPKASGAFNSFFGDRSQEPEITAEARRVILNWTGPGVLAVVTHDVNIRALTGIGPADGEGIVLRVSAKEFEVVGRIRP